MCVDIKSGLRHLATYGTLVKLLKHLSKLGYYMYLVHLVCSFSETQCLTQCPAHSKYLKNSYYSYSNYKVCLLYTSDAADDC